MSTAEHRYCYRHPDQETGLACSECGRPICADCATFAPVGIRCPDHAGAQGGKKPMQIKPPKVHRAQGISLATGKAPVTKTLIGINLAIYLVTVVQGAGLNTPGGSLYDKWLLLGNKITPVGFWPYGDLAHDHQWYRLVTSMFLHGFLMHILFNMIALWFIGSEVEQYLGTVRYLGLYFVSGLAGAAGALVATPMQPVVGASGAIFGVLGAMMILEWQFTGRFAGQAFTLILINLVFNFVYNGTGGNISIGGHIGGLIGGIVITLGYAHWRGSRAQYGKLSVEGVVVLVAVAAASLAIAYFSVRGYA
jgi:membrane associated rhomboid family serine protease